MHGGRPPPHACQADPRIVNSTPRQGRYFIAVTVLQRMKMVRGRLEPAADLRGDWTERHLLVVVATRSAHAVQPLHQFFGLIQMLLRGFLPFLEDLLEFGRGVLFIDH